MKNIQICPRYYRIHTDEGIEPAEQNYSYAHLDWTIPMNEIVLVLLDVWNYHFSTDTWARIEEICENKIKPMVDACREKGLRVIHAPASPVTNKYQERWPNLLPEDESKEQKATDDWPLAEFRRRTGRFASYATPHEPDNEERDRLRAEYRDIWDGVQPVGDEAVVRNGEELHLYCRERGILHLMYAGFNTNACIIYRDYGTLAMQRRGYNIILVRDCTTGMETHESTEELWLTRAIISTLEMFDCCSVTSKEVVAALDR